MGRAAALLAWAVCAAVLVGAAPLRGEVADRATRRAVIAAASTPTSVSSSFAELASSPYGVNNKNKNVDTVSERASLYSPRRAALTQRVLASQPWCSLLHYWLIDNCIFKSPTAEKKSRECDIITNTWLLHCVEIPPAQEPEGRTSAQQ